MATPKSKKIGASTYHVHPLPAEQALDAAVRFSNVIGPAVAAYKNGGAEAIGKALSSLNSEDIRFFTGLFRPMTMVETGGKKLGLGDGQDAFYNAHFAGNIGDLFQWLAFCAEVNFGAFFGAARSLFAKLSADEKPTTDTSPST